MQLADVNFDKKKQKVLWPLYARKEVKSNELPDFLTSEAAQIRKNRKIGFEYSKFKGLESVSGMRFLGAVTGSTSLYDDDNDDVKGLLDKEALRVRAAAGVPALSGDWGGEGSRKGGGSGTRLPITRGGQAAAGSTEGGRNRIFRHLCTNTSCRGL